MENCYAVRVSLPYEVKRSVLGQEMTIREESARSIALAWSMHVTRMVVYEHDDDGANRIHCHFMVEGSRVSKKRLQQLAQDACNLRINNPGHRASSLISFRSKDYDGHPAGYAYVTKGKYDPEYRQGFTEEECAVWKTLWVAPSEHTKLTPGRILYNDFTNWWNAKENRLPFDTEVTTDLILLRVRAYLYNFRYNGFYPIQARNERWVLVTNMCFQYRLPFPSNWKE